MKYRTNCSQPDTFGRRNLLLVGFPLMSLCLFFTGSSFYIPPGQAQLACVAVGMYLFMVIYSPSEGPVPFTYSAEAFPLHIRDIGMSSATAITWGFNFIISFTWPKLREAFGDAGAFYWYAAWNIFGWIFAYFLLPETKNLTLEELDMVFGVTNRKHAYYYWKRLPWYFKKSILRQDVTPMPELYQLDNPVADAGEKSGRTSDNARESTQEEIISDGPNDRSGEPKTL